MIHNILEDVPEVYKAVCELLIAAYKRYDLKDNMIYNISYRDKDGHTYVISVKKEER